MLGDWESDPEHDERPPVFIFVCKNTAIAKVMHEWLVLDKRPAYIPSAGIDGFRNRDGMQYTIRVDSKVVHETDSETAKSEENRWMRYTLDAVGKRDWTYDTQGRPVYPEGFEELANKLKRPLHPPGRDVRCIVSVGMLTEGWDCNTVIVQQAHMDAESVRWDAYALRIRMTPALLIFQTKDFRRTDQTSWKFRMRKFNEQSNYLRAFQQQPISGKQFLGGSGSRLPGVVRPEWPGC
jgi:hypothetical protein